MAHPNVVLETVNVERVFKFFTHIRLALVSDPNLQDLLDLKDSEEASRVLGDFFFAMIYSAVSFRDTMMHTAMGTKQTDESNSLCRKASEDAASAIDACLVFPRLPTGPVQ